jgi:ribosomal protein L21E
MGELVCRLKLREKVAYILEVHDLGNYMKFLMTQPQHMTPVLTYPPSS